MAKKIIRLTETELANIIKSVINEQQTSWQKGDKGYFVEQIQTNLNKFGYNLKVDGKFGPKTDAAVKDYQKKNNLIPNGIVTTQMLDTLNKPESNLQKFGYKTPTTTKEPTKSKTPQPSTKTPEQIKKIKSQIAKKAVGTPLVVEEDAYLIFNGEELQWVSNGKVIKTWKAISGLTWGNTPVKNWGELMKRYTSNPEEWSKDKDAGPTPPGDYSLGPIQQRQGDQSTISKLEALWDFWTGKFDSLDDSKKSFQANTDYSKIGWGNFRVSMTPSKKTNTYGRTSMYIHGGSVPGSHGCIDLTNGMSDFAKFYGTWLATTKKKSIQLRVNYKIPSYNTFFTNLVNSFNNLSSKSKVSKSYDQMNRVEKYQYDNPGARTMGGL